MKVTETGIECDLLEKGIKFGTDFYTCKVCFQCQSSGFCACDEPSDEALQPQTADWREAGVLPQEMAALAAILEVLGTTFVPNGIHFNLKEAPVVLAAADDCYELAASMRESKFSDPSRGERIGEK